MLTIGFGHTGPDVTTGTVISEETAERLLVQDMGKVERALASMVFVPLNQNQFDALCSFVFNLGAGNFRDSTLRRTLNAKDYIGCASEFTKWVFAGGRKLPGLVTRRERENALFLKPVLVK